LRRTEQRRAAVWALYQSDLLAKPLDDTFTGDAHAFTRALATATRDRQPELDELIGRYSHGWTLARIAPLERSILRVGLLELLHPEAVPGEEPIPPEGAIDEAVETAKRFCGAEAPRFVNGILGAVLRERSASGGPEAPLDGGGHGESEEGRDRQQADRAPGVDDPARDGDLDPDAAA
jgi:N utilization substance protein B